MDTNKSFDTTQIDTLFKNYSPFISEIKRRIIFTLSFFLLSTLLGFIFYENIIKILINVLNLNSVNLVFTSPFQFINLAVSCGMATGLILVFPLILFQILSFLRPALKRKEFKLLVKFMPYSIMLFLSGFGFGFLVMKWQIEIFLAKSASLGVGNLLDISKLLSSVILIAVIMGISFQSPIILHLLMKMGLVSPASLRKKRVWVYFGSLILAILLPIDSILADFILVLPIIALFELTIILNRNK